MTNNPTIDGVSRELPEIEEHYANVLGFGTEYVVRNRDHRMVVAVLQEEIKELRHLLAAPVVERQAPTAEMEEAGCQAYMNADGKNGAWCLHKSSMGHAYIAMRALDPEFTAPPQLAELQADMVSANADKEAYAQNAIDLRKRVDELQATVENMKCEQELMLSGAQVLKDSIIEKKATIERQAAVLRNARALVASSEYRINGASVLISSIDAILNGEKP